MARIAVLRGDAPLAESTARRSCSWMPAKALSNSPRCCRTSAASRRRERTGTAARGGDIDAHEMDRRLALLAFDNGDLLQAQKRFTELMRSGAAGEGAHVLSCADRRAQGDKEAATGDLPAAD